ncbi:tRNA (adenosine(37)-N6)-threonylcarbamoyltransferase complex transferase subunit TsaD [Candidatus Hepatincolaceae symbiont of Richtersius coronifer]
MIILGIESSCDETAVAIVDDKFNILAHCLVSQIKLHQSFGGVVPELAARAHLEVIDSLITQTIAKSKISLNDIDGFAGVCGPGLIGGLMVGAVAAKTLALVCSKPFLAINHLQAHALTPTLFENIKYPFLLLLVSGGHSQFVAVLGVNKYILLGETIDDAIGEAFDKAARLLGLPYPGGAEIQNLATQGDPLSFKFPKPLCTGTHNYQKNCNFSFAGLKTAVRQQIINLSVNNFQAKERANTAHNLSEQMIKDICASLQHTITDIVVDRTLHAIQIFEKEHGHLEHLVVSGGVAANLYLRMNLEKFVNNKGITAVFPPLEFCTDNGVMVAWCGIKKLQAGLIDELNTPINPRWSLEEL